MSWLEKIQKGPREEKIKIIWTICMVVVVLMLAVWVISAKFQKNTPKDTTLFDSVGKGFSDVKNNFKK